MAKKSTKDKQLENQNTIKNYFFKAPPRGPHRQKRKAEEELEDVHTVPSASHSGRRMPDASTPPREQTPPSRKKQRVSESESPGFVPESPQTSPSSLFSSADASTSTLQTDMTPSSPLPSSSREPTTPVALSVQQKTEDVISRIKAEARAQVASSSVQTPEDYEFKEDLSDSDDEDLKPDLPLPTKPVYLPKLVTPPPEARYSLRKRSPGASSRKARACVSEAIPGPSKPSRKAKEKQADDPLAAMLKEKAIALKLGKGEDAVARAELLLASRKEESDDEWDPPSRGKLLEFDEKDRKRLFGEKAGKGIGALLLQDEQERIEKQIEDDKAFVGVSLWESPQDAMHDHSIPTPPSTGPPFFKIIAQSIQNQNFGLASRLTVASLMRAVHGSLSTDYVEFLADLVLHPQCTSWTTVLFNAVMGFFEGHQDSIGVSERTIFRALSRLGAKQEVLCSIDLRPAKNVCCVDASGSTRSIVLSRLVALVTVTARSGTCPPETLPDFISVMVLIAMDPDTSSSLQRDTIISIHELGNRFSGANDALECIVCNKLIRFANMLSPANKAHLVSLVAGGSGVTRRIARWVAHSLVIDKCPSVTVDAYGDVPPLPILLYSLDPETSKEGGHPRIWALNEETDFVELRFYVKILGIALTNVAAYVREDKELLPSIPSVASGSPPSPSKNSDKPKYILELVLHTLESMQSRIVDTRAADLNKTRAKAALQELSSRLCYERIAEVKKTAQTKSNLRQFFSRPSVS